MTTDDSPKVRVEMVFECRTCAAYREHPRPTPTRGNVGDVHPCLSCHALAGEARG